MKFTFYLRGIKYFLLNYIFCWIPFYYLRHLIYKFVYKMDISSKASVHIGVKFYGHGRDLHVGKNTVVNPECRLDIRGGLNIGENVSLSREVFILTLTHDYDKSDSHPHIIMQRDRSL